MASAKQIAWRKKFARMSKAGKFKKKSKVRKPDGSRQSDFIPQYEFDEARRKKEGKPSIFGTKRMTRNELEQEELKNLNRNIPQFEMVNMSPQSQKILDSMKKRRDILSKKY